jgi:hypothetical protein
VTQLHGQQLPIQTFSLASNNFVAAQVDGLQMDWRLDLGLTALPLDQSNAYCFSAGFLQPNVNRFEEDGLWKKFNPSIEVKNTFRRDAIVLFSKEPDLILFGYKIMNMHGQIIISDQTKYRSSYQGRSIDLHTMSSGVYIMQILYLPEWMTLDGKSNYWVKYIKFIKP